jgi:hypothetical protein
MMVRAGARLLQSSVCAGVGSCRRRRENRGEKKERERREADMWAHRYMATMSSKPPDKTTE